MRGKDFDQELRVVPHVGNSLPLVGAVVGGPIGAAAGFAVQGLLGKGMNQAASARYRVTGSWDKPVMTLIEKHGAAAPCTVAHSGRRLSPRLPAAAEWPRQPPLLVPLETAGVRQSVQLLPFHLPFRSTLLAPETPSPVRL